MTRKVVELEPALHDAVLSKAHHARCKVKDLSTVLVAYALEHFEDAISNADRLLNEWEKKQLPEPGLRVVRVTRPR